ncbi:hypothetical protein TNCV_2075651 [Trichonephila clavipes]|nr:hypothetical protein TNCV_2075651 [Trichonephila clavipes]
MALSGSLLQINLGVQGVIQGGHHNLRPRRGAKVESRPSSEKRTQQEGSVRSRENREQQYSPYAEDFLVRLAARRLHESNLFESSSFVLNVVGSIAYHNLSCCLATLDLNTLSNLNIPNFFLELIGNINANLYSPERRLRKLVERFRTDSSQGDRRYGGRLNSLRVRVDQDD